MNITKPEALKILRKARIIGFGIQMPTLILFIISSLFNYSYIQSIILLVINITALIYSQKLISKAEYIELMD